LAIMVSKSCANDADGKSRSNELRVERAMRVTEKEFIAARERWLSILNPLSF
jgi:hypothetical protein